MSRYCDRAATRAELESGTLKHEAQGSRDRIRERTEERAEQLSSATGTPRM
jgi:hypothetical protein